MARLNTRQSSVARSALSPINGTVNNTPRRRVNRARTPGSGSEKENHKTVSGKNSYAKSDPQMPTPTSAQSDASGRGAKRRRMTPEPASEEQDTSQDEAESDEEPPLTPSVDGDTVEDVTDAVQQESRRRASSQQRSRTKSGKNVRFYDPHQDEAERRELKRKSRALEREFQEKRDIYLRDDTAGLTETVVKANQIFRGVKQTADATCDSRLLVSVTDVAHRKSAKLALGDGAVGIDVDEFVSKVISYMQRRAYSNVTSTQRRRMHDHDEEDEDGELLDWSYLGARACFPFNSRPAVPGFLLGALSVQKRIRAPTQRRAKQRDDGRAESRPEALQRQDLQQNEQSTVRHACAKIKKRLSEHCARAVDAVHRVPNVEDLDEAQLSKVYRANRITSSGGPSLFDFVVNPRSFGQTVENLFYISFLIKEGEVGVTMDDDDLPTLIPSGGVEQGASGRERTKHQAIFSIDYSTWKKLVKAFEIKESLIPHREEE